MSLLHTIRKWLIRRLIGKGKEPVTPVSLVTQPDEVFVQVNVLAGGEWSVVPTLARAHIAVSLANSIAAACPPGKYKLVLVREQDQ